MKMKTVINLLVIIMLLLLASPMAVSQDNSVSLGDEAFSRLEYSAAADYYARALARMKPGKRDYDEVQLRMADCYRLINEPAPASKAYQALIRRNYADKKPVIILNYALSLLKTGNYSEAKTNFESYLSKNPGDQLALNGLKSCTVIPEEPDHSNDIKIINLEAINSQFDDFAATYYDDSFKTLIFSSRRKGKTSSYTEKSIGGYPSDLYFAVEEADNKWSLQSPPEPAGYINTKADEGAAEMNNAQATIYFTRCDRDGSGHLFCKIYSSHKNDGKWSKPVVLIEDNTGNAGHPAVTADELTIIYSSNRPGGQGGRDLWKASRETTGKPFGKPENLGPLVNTSGDELFPSLEADTLLYFASDGLPGLGGLDIYSTVPGKNGFTTPYHLPKPFNSSSDDFSIHFAGNTGQGVFSSRRPGGKGGDDIYSFSPAKHKAIIEGSVKDEVTQEPLAFMPVNIASSDIDSATIITDKSGLFSLDNGIIRELSNLIFTFKKENYFTRKYDLLIKKIQNDTVYRVDILMKPITQSPVVLPDIYYDLDKWNILPRYNDSLMYLVKILNDNPAMSIELASHTDSRASSGYNDTLSLKRAQSVVSFLISRGIDKSRLTAIGYGEKIPRKLTKDIIRDGFRFTSGTLLSEEYINSLSDERRKEAAHQLNRRTEFTVLRKKPE